MTYLRQALLFRSALALGAFAVGCGGDDRPSFDSGTGGDAGPGVDAGPGADGGPGVDAGPGVDGGSGTDGGPRADGGGGGDCGGDCPTGFSCAPAGYCATAAGVPAFGRVYVVIFENKALNDVRGSANAPYLDGLMTSNAAATHYSGVTNPSLPNYIAMTSGDTWGIACDCHPTGTACTFITCNLALSSCGCHQDHEHIGDQLDDGGIEWREYGESMGTPCNHRLDTGDHYAAKHLPFLYYDDVLQRRHALHRACA